MSDSKNVLVTAGTGGIGSEVVKEFKKYGDNVYITSSTLSKIDNEYIFYWDMDKPETTKELLSTLKSKNIHIHTLIHCAHKFSDAKPLLAIKENDLLSSLNSNIGALFTLSKSLAKLMNRKKSGRIFFIGSYLSINPAPGKAMYIIEKNAMTGLALALNAEFSKNQVLTHILHPGLVKTTQVDKKIAQTVIDIIGEENLLSPSEIARNVFKIIHTVNAECVHHQQGNQEWKHSS